MAKLKRIGKGGVGFAALLGLLINCGCGNDFLGLEDYQRDILVGGLAVALLTQQPEQDAAAGGEEPGVPLVGRDGADGEDGLNCWDINGNGEPDSAEDVNGDDTFDALDCQGPAGVSGPGGADGQGGALGPAGSDGQDGTDGLHCWDLDGDGVGDPAEDANADGLFDVRDCQGSAGPPGPGGGSGAAGTAGPVGADGPEFFDVFIDDFFTLDGAPQGSLPIVVVSIEGPVLGIRDVYTGVDGLVGYRVAIPHNYDPGNDVTMRLFFHRTGSYEGDCFIFTVDARRLRAGYGIEPYGARQWVHVGSDRSDANVFLVVDLPLNTAAGLGYADDLAGGDLLAFELRTERGDERSYLLLGAEFFESESGTAIPQGVAGVFSEEPADCGFADCNENGLPDEDDIATGYSEDCQGDGIPDECGGGCGACIDDEDCPEGMYCAKGVCVEPT